MFATIPAVVTVVSTIIQAASSAVQLSKDAAPFLALIKQILSKKQITQEELDDIADQNDALFAEIQKPLTPEED